MKREKLKEWLEQNSSRREMKLYALSRVRGNSSDAGDLLQAAFLRLWEKHDQIPSDANLVAYAKTVMKNIKIDEFRRSRKSDQIVNNMPEAGRSDSPEGHTYLGEVEAAMKTLPEECQEILMLIAAEHKYKEISTRLDLPMGTVMSRLHRCRDKLCELVEC